MQCTSQLESLVGIQSCSLIVQNIFTPEPIPSTHRLSYSSGLLQAPSSGKSQGGNFMNAEVAYAYRERKAEAEPLGEQAYNLRALQHLKLKTVVKVAHSSH